MSWGVLVFVLFAVGVFVALRVISPRPEFPPLETVPDDPLLLAAQEKARAGLPQFQDLFAKYPQNALVKLRFVSNSDNVEHLWAEVKNQVSGSEYDVLLVTPPVTHSGRLERRYVCATDDIEDWQITTDDGDILGGFTQRAMFEIARRDGVKLSNKLQKIEKLYVDD